MEKQISVFGIETDASWNRRSVFLPAVNKGRGVMA